MIGLWPPVLSVQYKTLHFLNYFHVQALNNNSLSERVLKAVKYRWSILIYKFQQDAHVTEFI